eukprot:1179762-Prorocentrum_minimum.AAC.4
MVEDFRDRVRPPSSPLPEPLDPFQIPPHTHRDGPPNGKGLPRAGEAPLQPPTRAPGPPSDPTYP